MDEKNRHKRRVSASSGKATPRHQKETEVAENEAQAQPQAKQCALFAWDRRLDQG